MLRIMRHNQKGFTLVELMVVILILAILAAISIPTFVSYRRRAYNSAALTDIKNAYTAAQNFFTVQPTATAALGDLVANGFTQSPDVTVTVLNGDQPTLSITTVHTLGDKTFTVDFSGVITST